jgi:hypothetical protein
MVRLLLVMTDATWTGYVFLLARMTPSILWKKPNKTKLAARNQDD